MDEKTMKKKYVIGLNRVHPNSNIDWNQTATDLKNEWKERKSARNLLHHRFEKRVKTTIVLYLYILIHDDFRIYTRIEHFFGMLPRMAKLKKRHFCIYMRFSASLSFSP